MSFSFSWFQSLNISSQKCPVKTVSACVAATPRPLSPFLRRRQTRSNKHSQPASLNNDNRFSFPDKICFSMYEQEVDFLDKQI